jgi:transcription elongation factor SPT4
MARKGVATVKTPNREDRYITIDSDGDEVTPAASTPSERHSSRKSSKADEVQYFARELDKVDPAASRERLSPSKAAAESGPEPEDRQPRQAAGTVEQSRIRANALVPASFIPSVLPSVELHESPTSIFAHQKPLRHQELVQQPRPRAQKSAARSRAAGRGRGNASTNASLSSRTLHLGLTPENRPQPGQPPSSNPPPSITNTNKSDMARDMIEGGAYIAPGQQRNMRACMVCSVVRTQNQFLTQGCPNCEEILELAGNPEQINDCTSQVFEGLITVADTSRSWVARYQRLEGYKPGVYATQVEGILPDDVIGLVESAGINYVPRDGSEQDMLPKD